MIKLKIYFYRIIILLGVLRMLVISLFIRIIKRKQILIFGLVEHIGDIVCAMPIYNHLKNKNDNEKVIIWFVNNRNISAINLFFKNSDVFKTFNLDQFFFYKKIITTFGVKVVDLHLHGKKLEFFNGEYKNECKEINCGNYFYKRNLVEVYSKLANIDVSMLEVPQFRESKKNICNKMGLKEASYIVFHCKTNMIQKDWTKKKWNLLANDLLTKTKYKIVEIGLHPILDKNSRIIDCTNVLSLEESTQIITYSKMFVGLDSGPSHIANFLGVRTLVLLGCFSGFKNYMPFHKFVNSKLITLESFPEKVEFIESEEVIKELNKWI